MKIGEISYNNVIKIYNERNKINEKKAVNTKSDYLEISSLGKSLSSYSLDDIHVNNEEKIKNIQARISNGTYTSNSKLTAQKIIDIVKGKEV